MFIFIKFKTRAILDQKNKSNFPKNFNYFILSYFKKNIPQNYLEEKKNKSKEEG